MAILPPPYSARKPDPPAHTRPPNSTRSRSLSSHQRTLSDGPRLKHRFTFSNLRSTSHPKLSRSLFTLIKTENEVIKSHSNAAVAGQSVASQLSSWGDQSPDDAVHSISDKLGVLLNAVAEVEEGYAQALEEARCVLKAIRNTESSVQPARDRKQRIQSEIAKLNYKDPTSARIGMLEQELVRAEAECLVAEAQLVNITRAKLKEAYAAQFAAVVERAERQVILARNGRALLNLLDDTPIVPGEPPAEFAHESTAREIINQTENELHEYSLDPSSLGPVTSNAHVVSGGVIDGKAAATLAAPPPPAPAVPIIKSYPPVPQIPKAYATLGAGKSGSNSSAPYQPPPPPPSSSSGSFGFGGGGREVSAPPSQKLQIPKTREKQEAHESIIRERISYSDCITHSPTGYSDEEDDEETDMPGGFPGDRDNRQLDRKIEHEREREKDRDWECETEKLQVPGRNFNRDTHPAYRLDRSVSMASSVYSVATNVGKMFGRGTTVAVEERKKETEDVERARQEMVMF